MDSTKNQVPTARKKRKHHVDACETGNEENAVPQLEGTDLEPRTKRTRQGAGQIGNKVISAPNSPQASNIQGDLASISMSTALDFPSPDLPSSEENISSNLADCDLTLPPCNLS